MDLRPEKLFLFLQSKFYVSRNNSIDFEVSNADSEKFYWVFLVVYVYFDTTQETKW